MRSTRRRLMTGALYLAILIAVAIAGVFFGRNFTGLGPMPERASFARRLPAIPGTDRHFEFFFATNRDTDPANNAFGGHGRAIGQSITTGTFTVRISPSTPISPDAWHSIKHMELLGHTVSDEDACFARLTQAVRASPHNSLLIIVWGWRDRFQSAALKTAYTSYVLDINTPVLMFDWPGNQGDMPLGYARSRQMAYRSGPDLGRVLARVVRETGAERVWLMSSSLGCQTVSDAFSWMMTQPDIAEGGPKIEHVVMSAPDVSYREFNDAFSAKMKALSRNVSVFVTSNDQALLLSNWFNRRASLGRAPVARVVDGDAKGVYESQFDAAADLLAMEGDGADYFKVVDATPINRTRNLHHFFTDSPEFFDDLYLRLLRPEDHDGRNLNNIRRGDRSSFWILWDQ